MSRLVHHLPKRDEKITDRGSLMDVGQYLILCSLSLDVKLIQNSLKNEYKNYLCFPQFTKFQKRTVYNEFSVISLVTVTLC